jgi:PAS domain-containing protein
MGIVTVLGVGMAIVVVVHLRKHNRLLITVTDGLPQGVCMFDASARRVFCNQRYLELYRLTPQQMVPGATLRDLLEQCLTAGAFVAILSASPPTALPKSYKAKPPTPLGR